MLLPGGPGIPGGALWRMDPLRQSSLEDWAPALIPATALAIVCVLVYFRVPLAGCGASSALDEFGGGSKKRD